MAKKFDPPDDLKEQHRSHKLLGTAHEFADDGPNAEEHKSSASTRLPIDP